jgi:hypothetical protein
VSAQDNLSQQLFHARNNADFQASADNAKVTLYRGIGGVVPSQIRTDETGVHWTPSFEVAKSFADPDHPQNAGAEHPDEGVVIEAQVPKSSVLNRRSAEFKKLQDEKLILHGNSREKEVTLRPGAPITVDKLHHLEHDDLFKEFATKKVHKLGKEGTT